MQRDGKSDIKISVVIPVYNAEKYLSNTLNSLSKQTFQEFEIIMVNDGSKDRSLEIINDYQINHSNVVVVNQENKGVSVARNVGIQYAKGEYVCFLDADDLYHKDCLQKLYKIADSNADVVICDMGIFYHECKLPFEQQEDIRIEELRHKYQEGLFGYLMERGIGISSASKMYKRDFLLQHDLFFDEQSTYGEDMFFNWKVLLAAKIVYYANYVLYYYRQSRKSAVSRFHPNLYASYMREYENVRQFAKRNKIDMKKLDDEISKNLIRRTPSFLRMIVRANDNLEEKYRKLKILFEQPELKKAFDLCTESQKLSLQLRFAQKRIYGMVLCLGFLAEFRFKMARIIKSFVKFK